MEIRLAHENDRDHLKWLWSYCFDDSTAFVDWFFQNVYKPENTLCAAAGSSIFSTLQIIPRRIYVRGGSIPAGYVVGVSTQPEHRGRGLAGSLLRAALELMRSRGQLLSILVPFDFRFYRRYGWEVTHFLHRIEAPLDLLGRTRDARGIRTVGPGEWECLNAAYESHLSFRHGYLLRDEQTWRNIFSDLELDGGHGYGTYDGQDTLTGYVLFRISGRTLAVRELICNSPESTRALLGFLAGHAAQAAGAVWDSPVDGPADRLSTIPGVQVKLQPFLMSRPADLPALLAACRFSPSAQGEIDMAVTAPEGEAGEHYHLSICDGVAHLEGITRGEPDLAAPLGTWSRMIMGATTPASACRAGELESRSARGLDLADAVFTRQVNFTNELF